MPTLKLYVTVLSSDRQEQSSNQQQTLRNLASQGLLDQDDAAVESISTDPGTVTLRGQIIGRYAEVIAAELKELADSSGYATVPISVPDQKTAADGYYSVEDMDVGSVHESLALAQKYDGSVKRAGTRHSHYRSVTTTKRQLDHPFGNQQTIEIGVPAAARDVRWLDRETGDTEPATITATRTGEHGDVDVVDRTDSTFSSPGLIYDLPYSDEGPADVRVWDTRGHADRDDSDGLPRWQKVFLSTHDANDDPIAVENGLLRLTFDIEGQSLSVEEWDADTGSWSDVALGSTSEADDWQLLDVDVGHRADQNLSPVTVDMLTRWEHTDGGTHALDVSLQRGHDAVLVSRTPTASSEIPEGLEDKLSPIASTSILDGQPSRTLRARSEVSE